MIVTALARELPEDGQSAAIVFIPEGKNTITPTVNGKPKKITVCVSAGNGQTVAAKLQSDLEGRHAENVRPIFDFDHKDTGPAAAIPKKFYYEQGKGVMAEVEWTGAGKTAIEAKDYSYFSPVFLLGKDGVPNGLPKRGPLGALVNDPAFRDIPRIAAACAVDDIEPKANTMDELVQCGLLNTKEAAKDNAATVAAARVTSLRQDSDKVEALNTKVTNLEKENQDLKDKVEASETEVKKAKEEKADTIVKAAVADGRIAPKDEDTQKFFRDSIIAQGETAVKALNALPSKTDGLQQRQVKAGAAKQTDNQGGFEAEAEKLVKAGDASDKEEAFAMVAESNPDLYQEYCDSLGE